MTAKFAQSELGSSKQKAGCHHHDDTLPLLVYCSKNPQTEGSGSIFLGRHSYGLGTAG